MSLHLVVGDIHLGKGLSIGRAGIGSALNSRIVDQLNLLNWIYEFALDRKVDSIILTGDVFEDPRPHPMLVKLFIAWLRQCSDDNLKIQIIHGNHDIFRSGQFITSALDIISEADIQNVNVYQNINTIYEDGVCFTLLPFRDRKSFNVPSHDEAVELLRHKLTFESADIPDQYKKVLIGHLAIEGSIYVGDEISDSSNELFCPVNMFKDYDYVWMGHVHKPQVLSTANPYVAHVGSLDTSDFGETDHDKIVVLIDTDSPEFYSEHKLPTRPLIKMTVPVAADVVDTTEFVLNAISDKNAETSFKGAIVRIEVQLQSPDLLSLDRKRVEDAVFKLGAFHIAGLRETKKVALVKKKLDEEITNFSDLKTAVKTYAAAFVEEKSRDAFLQVAEDMIKEFRSELK